GRKVLLDGDVHLQRDDLTVTGEHAVAEYSQQPRQAPKPKPKSKSGKKAAEARLGGETVDKFTVDGKVHVERGGRTADGERGILDVPAQTLVLTGTPEVPPVLRDGSEMLSGERILLRLDSEDVDVVRPRLVLKRSMANEAQKSIVPVKVEANSMTVHKEARLARFVDQV